MELGGSRFYCSNWLNLAGLELMELDWNVFILLHFIQYPLFFFDLDIGSLWWNQLFFLLHYYKNIQTMEPTFHSIMFHLIPFC